MLREVVRPYEEAREAFVPRFAAGDPDADPFQQRDAVRAELARFLQLVDDHLYPSGRPWPVEQATLELKRLMPQYAELESHFLEVIADPSRGMRRALDLLTHRLEERAVETYVYFRVFLPIRKLSGDDQDALAAAYLRAFRAIPGLKVPHPMMFLTATGGKVWEEVLLAHAHLVLGWTRGTALL